MKTFEQHLTEERRLLILRALRAAAGFMLNHISLRTFCESMGFTVSLDKVLSDIAWLHEQELLQSSETAGVTIAKITSRGSDVARGTVRHPGVKLPEPGME
jgi:hypothetical protein